MIFKENITIFTRYGDITEITLNAVINQTNNCPFSLSYLVVFYSMNTTVDDYRPKSKSKKYVSEVGALILQVGLYPLLSFFVIN